MEGDRTDWKDHPKEEVGEHIPNFLDDEKIAEERQCTWVELSIKKEDNHDDAINDASERKMGIVEAPKASVLANRAASKENEVRLAYPTDGRGEPFVLVDVAGNEGLKDWIEDKRNKHQPFYLKIRNGEEDLLTLSTVGKAATGTPDLQTTGTGHNIVSVGGNGTNGSSEEDRSSCGESRHGGKVLFKDKLKRKRDNVSRRLLPHREGRGKRQR